MPELFVIEDDIKKLSLAKDVIANLAVLNNSWKLEFDKLITTDWKIFFSKLGCSSDPFLVVDAELIASAFEPNWAEAIDALMEFVHPKGFSNYEVALEVYTNAIGKDLNKAWAVRILAWARVCRVPYLVISQKDHTDSELPIASTAQTARIPFNWLWTGELAFLEDAQKKQKRIELIANDIHSKWLAHSGGIVDRLWPSKAIDNNWFRVDGLGQDIGTIPHNYPQQITDSYKNEFVAYLERLFLKEDRINIQNILSKGLHETVKATAGYYSIAHGEASGDQKQIPLAALVLLVAAWDPDPSGWLSQFSWPDNPVANPLISESATRFTARATLLSFGGEGGVFEALFVDESSPKDENGIANLSKAKSTVKSVKMTGSELRIELEFDCDKLRSSLDGKGRSGKNALKVKAAREWLSHGEQICDVWFEDNTLVIGRKRNEKSSSI